jgi:hypothetical protein
MRYPQDGTFIVVTTKPIEAGSMAWAAGKMDEHFRMELVRGSKKVLEFAFDLGQNEDDPRNIFTIYSIDYLGRVQHYKVGFDQKLILVTCEPPSDNRAEQPQKEEFPC